MSDIVTLLLPHSATAVERLGWVLVHSLWQFALVSLLAGAAVRAMHRCSAPSRYGVLLFAMTVMVGVPAATWLLLPIDAPEHSSNQAAPGIGQESPATTG